MSKKKNIVVDIDKKKIETVLKWTVHYDRKTGRLCGAPNAVWIAEEGQMIPPLQDPQPHIEVRDAVMIVLKKEKKDGS